MPTDTPPEAVLTGEVPLYRQPELLSKEQHGALGINSPTVRFGFAAKAQVSPLTVPEFAAASLSFPIIFVGSEQQPVAVMGLEEGQNLFATPETGFEPDVYITSYIRRYPFVLASSAQEEGSQERLLVGIDRAYEHISENAETPFFENGEPSQYTKNCIQFCNDFQSQVALTRSFVDLLKQLELLETRQATFQPQNADGTPAGELQTVAEFYAVSLDKLNALPAEKLVELRNNGALQVIYAHLNSLQGWDRLIVRALIRQQQQQAEAAAND